MRDYRGINPIVIRDPDTRHQLLVIDEWARQMNAAVKKLSFGKQPTASGPSITIDPTTMLNFLFLPGKVFGQTLLQLGTETPLTIQDSASSSGSSLFRILSGANTLVSVRGSGPSGTPVVTISNNFATNSPTLQVNGVLRIEDDGTGFFNIDTTATGTALTSSSFGNFAYTFNSGTLSGRSIHLAPAGETHNYLQITRSTDSSPTALMSLWRNSAQTPLAQVGNKGQMYIAPDATSLALTSCSAPSIGATTITRASGLSQIPIGSTITHSQFPAGTTVIYNASNSDTQLATSNPATGTTSATATFGFPNLVLKAQGSLSVLTSYQNSGGDEVGRVAISNGIPVIRLNPSTTNPTGMIEVVPPETHTQPSFGAFRSVFTEDSAVGYSGLINIDATISDSSGVGVGTVIGANLKLQVTNAASEYNTMEVNCYFDNDDALAGANVTVGRAIHYECRTIGSGAPGSAYGFLGGVRHIAVGATSADTGAPTLSAGVYYCQIDAAGGAATIPDANGITVCRTGAVGRAVTNYRAVHIGNTPLSGVGSIVTYVALEIDAISNATNNWVLRSAGGQSAHTGNFRIGSTSAPTAKLHLDAGAAGASTAPIKLTSGTSMTSAEVGAIEYTTDDLFFTINTGTARKRILFADPTGGLTSGRVPFATTNGRLTDDSDMTFATDTLTVTKVVGSTSVKVGTAAGYISSDGSTGATGSFTTTDLKTVTVKDGIITAIV